MLSALWGRPRLSSLGLIGLPRCLPLGVSSSLGASPLDFPVFVPCSRGASALGLPRRRGAGGLPLPDCSASSDGCRFFWAPDPDPEAPLPCSDSLPLERLAVRLPCCRPLSLPRAPLSEASLSLTRPALRWGVLLLDLDPVLRRFRPRSSRSSSEPFSLSSSEGLRSARLGSAPGFLVSGCARLSAGATFCPPFNPARRFFKPNLRALWARLSSSSDSLELLAVAGFASVLGGRASVLPLSRERPLARIRSDC